MPRYNLRKNQAPVVRRVGTYLWLGALVASGAGCDMLDRLLAVEAPSQVEARNLENPRYASLLVDGAIADFECGLGHYIVAGGLIGSELADPQQSAAQWDYDRRTLAPAGGWYATSTCDDRLGAYTPLSTARWAADDVLTKLGKWTDEEVPKRTQLVATAAVYSGYSHILLGEGFCSAAFDAGPEVTRMAVFERATDRFTQAIAAAETSGRTDLYHTALVGRARALLNLGRATEAAEDARRVPAGFAKFANYSSAHARAENKIFVLNNRSHLISVYNAFRDITYAGVPDSRVAVVNTGKKGANQQTAIWTQTKYPTASSPIPIARWVEAQLIVAEAEGGKTAVEIINALHEQAGLPKFESTDPLEISRQIVEERRRELFLEGHHLGDLIRYDLPLDPAPGTVFVNGGVYGDMRCMPLPDVERLNNPSIKR